MSEKSQPVYYFFNCKACEEPINFRAEQIYEVVANYKCALCSADNWIDPNSNNFQEIKKEKFNALRMPLIKKSKSYDRGKNNKNNLSEKYDVLKSYKSLAFLLMVAATGYFIYSLGQYFDAPKVAREMLEDAMITSTVSYLITMFSLFCLIKMIDFLFDLDKHKSDK